LFILLKTVLFVNLFFNFYYIFYCIFYYIFYYISDANFLIDVSYRLFPS